MWQGFVELIRAGIFGAAQVCGGSLGGGILVVSLLTRIALMPLSLRLARRARDQQQRLTLIKNDVARIKLLYAKDVARQLTETQALYRKHDIRMFQPTSVVMMIVQAPFFAGLFAAVRTGLGQRVRFAWIVDLSRSNAILVVIVAALSAIAAAMTPVVDPKPGQTASLVIISVASTLFFLWSASSAVAISWGGGVLVSMAQNAILARDARKRAS